MYATIPAVSAAHGAAVARTRCSRPTPAAPALQQPTCAMPAHFGGGAAPLPLGSAASPFAGAAAAVALPRRAAPTRAAARVATTAGLVLVSVGDGSMEHLDRKWGIKTPKTIPIPSDGKLVVGRKEGDVVIGIDTVSSRHCVLEVSARGQLFVTDLKSSNGTWINGKRIGSNSKKRLDVGAVLIIGDEFLCQYEVQEAQEARARSRARPSTPAMPAMPVMPSAPAMPDTADVLRSAEGVGKALGGFADMVAKASEKKEKEPAPPKVSFQNPFAGPRNMGKEAVVDEDEGGEEGAAEEEPKRRGGLQMFGGGEEKEAKPERTNPFGTMRVFGGNKSKGEIVAAGDTPVEAIILDGGSSMGAASDTGAAADLGFAGGIGSGAMAFMGDGGAGGDALFTLVPVGGVGEAPPYDAIVIEKESTLVGRVPAAADIPIPCEEVSTVHVRVDVIGGSLYLTDLESKNGTYIDGVRLEPGRQYLVEAAQDVAVSEKCFYRVVRGAAAPGTVAVGRARGQNKMQPARAITEVSTRGGGQGMEVYEADEGEYDLEEGEEIVPAMSRASASIVPMGPGGVQTNALAQGQQAEEGGVFGLLKGMGAAISNSTVQVNYQYKPVIQLGGKAAGTGELKSAILVEIVGKDRGLRASSEQRNKIEELARALEAKNPTPAPLKSPLLNGRWALQYTTNKGVLGAGRPAFLRPSGPIYQTVDIFNLKALNEQEFSAFGLFNWTNSAASKLSAQSESRVSVESEGMKIGPFQMSAPPKTPARQALEWEKAATGDMAGGGMGWLDTTYLDTDLRVSRSASGDLYVMTRDDPNDA